MDVRTLMGRAARHYSTREAIVHNDRRLTFAEAWSRGVRLANGLRALGIQPGDRVGVLEDNSVEAADLFQGAAIANAVRVPLYPRNGRPAHLHMLGHTSCKVLLVSAQYAHEVEGIAHELPELEHVFVRGGDYETWLAAQSDVDPDVAVQPDDYFIIRHTGGTTGKSKGVAYTHKAWLAAGRDWFYTFPPVEPGDRCLHLGPISHGSGYQYLPVWLAGGCNVMIEHFETTATLDLIEGERINYAFMVPTMVNAVVHDNSARGRDFSAMKCLLIAAAPIQDATALAAREVFGDCLYQGYGQTEVLPVSMMNSAQWFAELDGSNPLRSCGLALPFAEVEIWDEENQPIEANEVGEIVARSDGMMSEFWNNPQATAERVVNGWIKTGDLGKLDANGYLYIVDRADDMIISGGYNIWPAELENVIAGHPQVLEVAVFGVPHERWGETPHAVCVVAPHASVSEDEIVDMVAGDLGSYKKPGGVTLTTEPLPKSPVGKVKRKDLREPFWEGVDRRVSGS
ncbi:MAG: AMP-binding protein [Pseudomonadales bacterium]|nr:AMP-binding protein [Pseudomonadales bacterium]MDP6472189.1 AMP-binding protein [Pseudomonadales bacterium]MDP6826559.1 AMP-binding protein [Pseudomonadales bacterium]MDP6970170.1 AMP-binding protein [Pseudomonadales bacterium]